MDTNQLMNPDSICTGLDIFDGESSPINSYFAKKRGYPGYYFTEQYSRLVYNDYWLSDNNSEKTCTHTLNNDFVEVSFEMLRPTIVVRQKDVKATTAERLASFGKD